MKKLAFILFILTSFSVSAQTRSLNKIWETDTILAIPESVFLDKEGDILYVSLINGAPWNADGKGGISKLSTNGKKYDSTWITGLNAPKGMGISGKQLFVADLDKVVVIDKIEGKIKKTITIDGAQGLNDITITDNGIVYVSDSRVGRIWKIEKDIASLYLDSVKGVNGLKAVGNELFIGAGKNFIKADGNKKITQITEVPQNIDGIEPVGNGDFILTSWAGYIFYVDASGRVETLLDTHLENKNTADIGYNKENRIVYVPTFNAKRVVAYQLK